jgi:hypothetical protein
MALSSATVAAAGVNISNAMDKKNDKKVGVFKLQQYVEILLYYGPVQ